MTASEAVRRIKEHNRIHNKKERQAILITEALNMAVKALEKQIPMKPKYRYIRGSGFPYCPVCDENVLCDSYCPKCGQKIDWSDEND